MHKESDLPLNSRARVTQQINNRHAEEWTGVPEEAADFWSRVWEQLTLIGEEPLQLLSAEYLRVS